MRWSVEHVHLPPAQVTGAIFVQQYEHITAAIEHLDALPDRYEAEIVPQPARLPARNCAGRDTLRGTVAGCEATNRWLQVDYPNVAGEPRLRVRWRTGRPRGRRCSGASLCGAPLALGGRLLRASRSGWILAALALGRATGLTLASRLLCLGTLLAASLLLGGGRPFTALALGLAFPLALGA